MKTTFIILTIVTFLLSATTKAQKSFSISARYGINTAGLSATAYLPNAGAVEGMFTISHDRSRVLLTTMYETFMPLGHKHNFILYAGAGLHAGYIKTNEIVHAEFIKYGEVRVMQDDIVVKKKLLTGADAILGINYNIPSSHFYVGLDCKPNTDFINGSSMMVDGGVRLGIEF